MRGQRHVHLYSPSKDLEERWPDWSLYESCSLPEGAERFHCESKVILVNPSRCGLEWATAHAVAHLHLGHVEHAHRGFSAEQEADARGLAALWMDYAARSSERKDDVDLDRIPLDGDPSIIL